MADPRQELLAALRHGLIDKCCIEFDGKLVQEAQTLEGRRGDQDVVADPEVTRWIKLAVPGREIIEQTEPEPDHAARLDKYSLAPRVHHRGQGIGHHKRN